MISNYSSDGAGSPLNETVSIGLRLIQSLRETNVGKPFSF